MSSLITYVIVYHNTPDITEKTLNSIILLSTISNSILIVNNGENDDLIKQYNSKCTIVKNSLRVSPSNIHGFSIDLIMPRVSTRYCCVIDSDAAFLCKGFDELLIKNIGGKNGLISTHERTFKKEGVYTNHADLMFFETTLARKLRISFSAEQSRGIDTGGKFGLTLARYGRRVNYLTEAQGCERVPGLSRQYKLDGMLIFSHMGRGTSGWVPAHKGGYENRKSAWIAAMDKILKGENDDFCNNSGSHQIFEIS